MRLLSISPPVRVEGLKEERGVGKGSVSRLFRKLLSGSLEREAGMIILVNLDLAFMRVQVGGTMSENGRPDLHSR